MAACRPKGAAGTVGGKTPIFTIKRALLCAAAWLGTAELLAQTPPSGEPDRTAIESATVQITAPPAIASLPGRHAFDLRGGALAIARQVLEQYGVHALAAEQRDPANIHFETEDVDYDQAKQLMQLATGLLVIPLDATHVLLARDTKENRQLLQREATEVLHLPALSAAEIEDVTNIAKTVFEVVKVSADLSAKTVSLEAPASRLSAFNATIDPLFAGDNQILVDLSLSEADLSRTVNLGVQLPQSSTAFNLDTEVNTAISNNASAVDTIISSGLASATDYTAIAAILVEEGLVTGVLSEPFALFGGGLTETGLTFGTLTANLALNSSDTRTLDRALVRVRENEPATLKVGTRYPVETGLYTGAYASSTGTVVSSTTPEIQYEDLGFEVKVRSRTQAEDRVQLAVEMKIESLAGSSINNIPVLTSRTLKTVISVPEKQSAMFASVLSRQESGSLDQLPGFAQATNNTTEDDQSELVLTVTPYLAHHAHQESSGPVILLAVHE